jgi:hypothetical protein
MAVANQATLDRSTLSLGFSAALTYQEYSRAVQFLKNELLWERYPRVIEEFRRDGV